MRTSIRILAVSAIAFGGIVAASVPSGAGADPVNTVSIVKVVTGDVPAGTTFTVDVTCESQLQPVAQAPVSITFDAHGDPTVPHTVTTPAGTVCTATETVNGGATSTTYACLMDHGPSDENGPPFLGNCTGDNEATFGDVIADTATITVTNNFATAPPLQPVTPAAQAVQAAPAFTG